MDTKRLTKESNLQTLPIFLKRPTTSATNGTTAFECIRLSVGSRNLIMGDLDPPLSVLHTEQLLRLVIYMWVMEKSVESKAPIL